MEQRMRWKLKRCREMREREEKGTSEFRESLREEVLHQKEKRAEFVIKKLAYVATFFGLGSVQAEWVMDFHWLLFAVPFVSLAFDVYIFAEDYKVKRIGTFNRIFRYATTAERNWERFVNQHRERVAVWASLVITLIALIASAGLISLQNPMLKQGISPEWAEGIFLVWVTVAGVFTSIVFYYYHRLLGKLPKPHLLSRPIKELLNAPPRYPPKDSCENLATALRDRLAITLLIGTGITEKELEGLTFADLSQQTETPKSAVKIGAHHRCRERTVPYYVDTVSATDRIDFAQEVANIMKNFSVNCAPANSTKNKKTKNHKKNVADLWWSKNSDWPGKGKINVYANDLVSGRLPRYRLLWKTIKTITLFISKLPLFAPHLSKWIWLGLPLSWTWLHQEVLGRTWAIDKILAQYPIVIDGMVQVVDADELRRTYARRLYESEKNLKIVQHNLGSDEIRSILGYVGPIMTRLEQQSEVETKEGIM